jgi:hypothetical protein
VRSGGLYGYVDTVGRVIVEPQYEIAGSFWRGFAEVSIDGKSALIDPEGRQVLEPRFARAHPFTADVFWVLEGTRHHYDGRPGLADLVDYEAVTITNDVRAGGKWGMIDRAGVWIRPPEFTAIRMFDRNDPNLVRVKADTGWGVIRPDGTWFLEPKFEALGQMSNGLVIARIGGQSGQIDRTGTFVIPPKFDDLSYFQDDGLARAKAGALWGLIDRSGAWVIEPKYEFMMHGRASDWGAIWVRVEGKWGAIDRSGRVVVSPQFSQSGAYICEDGWIIGYTDLKKRIAVRRDDSPLVTPTGELLATDCVQPFQIQVGDKFGYVGRDLRPITEVEFESASTFWGDVAFVKLNGKFGYIKRDGTWLIEPRFDEARLFSGESAVVKLGGKVGCIKRDGTWLVEPQFEEIRFGCSDLITRLDGKLGHIKPDGTWLIDPRLEKVFPFAGRFVAVKIDGKFGVVDEAGAWVVEPRWRSFGLFLDDRGLVAAKLDDKWGFIDASGTLIVDARYEESSYFEGSISWVKAGSTWCAIDRRGQSVSALPCQSTNPMPKPGTFTSLIRG